MNPTPMLLVLGLFALTAKAQYPSNIEEDVETNFQAAQPIAIFARSRVARGGGYGNSAPIAEILPVPGPSYSNQQIETLPNYGGGQISPIKEEPFNGGYNAAPEPYKQPVYGGAPIKEPYKQMGPGYQSKPLTGGPGYNSPTPVIQNFGPGPSSYGQQQQQYKPVPQRQPNSYGYNSGSGISFGHNHGGGSSSYGGSHQQQQQQPGFSSGYGQQQPGIGHQSQQFAPGQNYGSAPLQHDSYSKPPTVGQGQGYDLAPPPQKAPTGYGR